MLFVEFERRVTQDDAWPSQIFRVGAVKELSEETRLEEVVTVMCHQSVPATLSVISAAVQLPLIGEVLEAF